MIAKTGKNESMQAKSKSSRRMLRLRYHGSLASSVVDICMKRVEFEHYSVAYFDCITTIEVDWSCLFPGSLTVVAFSYMRCPYSLIHVSSSDNPRR